MIVLDTNVISEAMKPNPNPAVMAWLNGRPAEELSVTTITIAELLFGMAMLPDGRRRLALSGAYDRLMRVFEGRVLDFDQAAAQQYAVLASAARASGRPVPLPDGDIAAIAAAHSCSVATRNLSPFTACGLVVIDPWQS
jgi:predicted nucleic acid-binding protein